MVGCSHSRSSLKALHSKASFVLRAHTMTPRRRARSSKLLQYISQAGKILSHAVGKNKIATVNIVNILQLPVF